MKKFFQKLIINIGNSFSVKSLVFHVLAIVGTSIVVLFGFDRPYFEFFNSSPIQTFFFPAVIIGSLGIMFLVIITFLFGIIKKNKTSLTTSIAIVQATFIGWLISSFYKTFTGRGHPDMHSLSIDPTATDFHFGFMKGGIFWGWPSGHSTVAFAVGVTLFILFPKSKFRYLALLFSLYVAIGVSTNIHWFSDALAGALFGIAIGICVGRSFLYPESHYK